MSDIVKVRLAAACVLLSALALGAETEKEKPKPKPPAVRRPEEPRPAAAPAPRPPAARPEATRTEAHPAAPSHPAVRTLQHGNAIVRRPDGHVQDLHDEARHMDVHHGPNGERTVTVQRADGARLVAQRGRPGYIEKPYIYHGHQFLRRTYYFHGHAYDRFYVTSVFHGVRLDVYTPNRYYRPTFYGWAFYPWRTRVVYAWGWGGQPWYGYYGGYFQPYPYYAGPTEWLTDQMIAGDLQAGYEANQAADAPPPPPAPDTTSAPALTPETKTLVANEVQTEIQLENAEAALNAAGQDQDPASSGIPRLLADGKPHVFVVGGSLELVNDATQAACAVSDGDVLQLTQAPAADAKTASLVVLASKGTSECAKSTQVSVTLDELQEMQNQMRESIDNGLQQLQQAQGSSGLPPMPASAAGPAVTAPFAPLAPPPDPNGAAELNQEKQDGTAAEKEITAQARAEQ